jgi:hypothetical protein
MATALSGTGPAYVFLFMEAMVDAGVHLGFPRRLAEQLVAQTVRGSVEYLHHGATDPVHLARLRNRGHLPRRDLCRGPVLPGEGRFPHRHFPGDLGGL